MTRTYTFNLKGEYGFYTGHDSSNRQYLLGMTVGSVLTLQFSAQGDSLFLWEDRAPYGLYEETMLFIAAVHEVTFAPIVVKHFQSQRHKIQICDLPLHYEEFLEDRHRVPHERQGLYEAAITEWMDEGNFVFFWGRRYFWFDGEGKAMPH
jgi:hypothetical protein